MTNSRFSSSSITSLGHDNDTTLAIEAKEARQWVRDPRCNLNRCPVADIRHKPDPTKDAWVMGDAHGCLLKIIKFLVFHYGVIITPMQYLVISAAFNESVEEGSELTSESLEQFKQTCNELELHPERGRFFLIGDVFADRFGDDLLTIIFLNALYEKGLQLWELASNHTWDCLRNYNADFTFERDGDDETEHTEYLLASHLKGSADKLSRAISKGLISREQAKKMFRVHFEHHMVLFSYQVSRDEKSISIGIHGRTSATILPRVTEVLGVENHAATIRELVATLDNINKAFTSNLANNELLEKIAPRADCSALYDHSHSFEEKLSNQSAIAECLWRRDVIVNWPMNKEYAWFYYHGHHGAGEAVENVFNLDKDNRLGKGFEYTTESYHALYVEEHPTLRMKLSPRRGSRKFQTSLSVAVSTSSLSLPESEMSCWERVPRQLINSYKKQPVACVLSLVVCLAVVGILASYGATLFAGAVFLIAIMGTMVSVPLSAKMGEKITRCRKNSIELMPFTKMQFSPEQKAHLSLEVATPATDASARIVPIHSGMDAAASSTTQFVDGQRSLPATSTSSIAGRNIFIENQAKQKKLESTPMPSHAWAASLS